MNTEETRSAASGHRSDTKRSRVCPGCGKDTGAGCLKTDCPMIRKAASLDDKLAVMAHKMSDAELRATIEEICGNPKRAGSRARRLNMGESLALAALMAEEARRVHA